MTAANPQCPICKEPMDDSDETEYWGEVEEVHTECNPERTVGWEP